MKKALFLISVIFVSTYLAHAEPVPPDQVPILPGIDSQIVGFNLTKILESLQDKFSQLTSFTYVAQVGTAQDKSFSTLLWKEAGGSYYYDALFVDNVQHTQMQRTRSFDGERTTNLRTDNVIEIHKGALPIRFPMGFPSPLDAYSFLITDKSFLSVNDLGSASQIWLQLASRVRYAGTRKFMNHDCIILRFLGSYCKNFEQNADFDVYFDSQSLMLTGWEAYDSHKFLIERLEIIESKTASGKLNASSFIFPSHCKITQYQWPGTITGPTGVIKYYKSVRDEFYKDVQINCFSPEDVQIDPSTVNGIFDVDANKYIPVPK